MSWDASLVCGCCGSEVGEFNYTHNTNHMIDAAMNAAGNTGSNSWLNELQEMTSSDSIRFLGGIIKELENTDYDTMNPDNGWGSREGVVQVLSEMVQAASKRSGRMRWRVYR